MNENLRFIIEKLYLIPVILISISFHEFMHGYISFKQGDPTAKAMGRLTLNPIKHIDPVGLLMMLFAWIGWAKPVPINPSYYKKFKLGTVLTSLAGPLSNLAIAFLFCIPWLVMSYANPAYLGIDYTSTDAGQIIYNILTMFVFLNVSLAAFNILPLPPLDGYKILSGVLPTNLYFKIMNYERYIGLVFLAIALLKPSILTSVVTPVRTFIIEGMVSLLNPLILPLVHAFAR